MKDKKLDSLLQKVVCELVINKLFFSDIYRVSANSASTKSSKYTMPTFWAKRMPTCTVPGCTWLPLLLLNSLLILLCLHSKLPRLRSKQLLVLLTPCAKPCLRSWRKKVFPVSIRVWCHCGWDKFHTPWWSSPASKRPLNCCTSKYKNYCVSPLKYNVGLLNILLSFTFLLDMLFPSHVLNVPRANNWLSPSLPVTLLVSSAPSFPIQLMLLSPNWIKLRAPPPSRLPNLWASWVCGTVWLLVSLWLVHSLPCNGSFMMVSRLLWLCPVPHHQRCPLPSRPNWKPNPNKQRQ